MAPFWELRELLGLILNGKPPDSHLPPIERDVLTDA